MGRKKKKIDKPWCWYCNREFDDEKILIQHQKAKHFKCHICHKKLFSGPGLSIHCMQVHKETIDKIPAAANGRDNIHVEIYGMQGIPAGAYRGAADEEPDEKRSRIEPPPPMPTPMPFPQHFPSFGMPPMPSGPPPPQMGYGMPPGMPPGMIPPPHGMPGAYPPPHSAYPGAPPPGVYMPPPGMPGAYPPPRPAMGMPPMGIPGGHGGPPMGGPPGMHGGPPMGMPGGHGPPGGPPQRSRFDQPTEDRWGGPPARGVPRTPPYENGQDPQDYGRHDDGGGGTYHSQGDYDDRYRERDAAGPGSSRFDPVKTEVDQQQQSVLSATAHASAAAAAVVASKLGSRTRIVHPDDHALSLEERRTKMLFEKRTTNSYH